MPETSTGLQAGGGTDWSGAPARSEYRVGGDLGALVSRVQLDETLSQVSDVVLTVVADGRIGYVSPAVLVLLGFEQEEVLDHHLTDFLDPDDANDITARLHRGPGHNDVGTRVLVRHATDGWREVLLFVHAGPALDAVGYRAVVLRDAKDRGHTLDALRQRLAFEDLLTRVASSFIHRPAHEVDECISDALSDIGTFVGVDRVYVFVSRDDGGMLENTHEWTAEGVAERARRAQRWSTRRSCPNGWARSSGWSRSTSRGWPTRPTRGDVRSTCSSRRACARCSRCRWPTRAG